MTELSTLKSRQKGFAMVEVIVGITISSALLISFSSLSVQARQASRENRKELQAALYLREAIEIVKDIEQTDFAILEDPSCLYPAKCSPMRNGMDWALAHNEENLDGVYERYLNVNQIYRSALPPHDIISPPGVLDSDSLKVTAHIRWKGGTGERNAEIQTIVYRNR